MAQRYFTFSPPSNPFLQILYVIVGGLLLIGAIVMGAVVLAVGVGVALILALAVYLRILWLNRRIRRAAKKRGSSSSGSGDVLEVEYSVVDERDDQDSRG